MMTVDDVVRKVALACEQAGGQTAWANRIGVSQVYVNDVLHRRRPPGPAILRALGLDKVESYQPIKLSPAEADEDLPR